MNAQPDFFPPPAAPAQTFDLRHRSSWAPMLDQKSGVTLDDVDLSTCGRYTIVRSVSRGEYRYVAFRRNVIGERWNPPTVIGGYGLAELARHAAWEHAEGNP